GERRARASTSNRHAIRPPRHHRPPGRRHARCPAARRHPRRVRGRRRRRGRPGRPGRRRRPRRRRRAGRARARRPRRGGRRRHRGLRAERILAQDGGNTVLSPLSVATAFAMVSAGADEPTEAQIAGVFGFPEQDRLHEAMNALTAALDEADGGDPEAEVVLDRADALWAQAGFDVEPDYLDTLAEHYGAGVPTTDFEHDPDGARRAINAAVAEATRDRIEELMPEGTVTEDTRAVVVDALYLKAPWAHPFSSDATAPAPFHRADGTTVEVPMMRDPALSARAATAPDHTAVELPYAGGQLAMLLVVPAE